MDPDRSMIEALGAYALGAFNAERRAQELLQQNHALSVQVEGLKKQVEVLKKQVAALQIQTPHDPEVPHVDEDGQA